MEMLNREGYSGVDIMIRVYVFFNIFLDIYPKSSMWVPLLSSTKETMSTVEKNREPRNKLNPLW